MGIFFIDWIEMQTGKYGREKIETGEQPILSTKKASELSENKMYYCLLVQYST